jgi:hypothetical protein
MKSRNPLYPSDICPPLLLSIEVKLHSSYWNLSLSQVKLPNNLILIGLFRKGDFLAVGANPKICNGDFVLALIKPITIGYEPESSTGIIEL